MLGYSSTLVTASASSFGVINRGPWFGVFVLPRSAQSPFEKRCKHACSSIGRPFAREGRCLDSGICMTSFYASPLPCLEASKNLVFGGGTANGIICK
jgi:hypothetical protein